MSEEAPNKPQVPVLALSSTLGEIPEELQVLEGLMDIDMYLDFDAYAKLSADTKLDVDIEPVKDIELSANIKPNADLKPAEFNSQTDQLGDSELILVQGLTKHGLTQGKGTRHSRQDKKYRSRGLGRIVIAQERARRKMRREDAVAAAAAALDAAVKAAAKLADAKLEREAAANRRAAAKRTAAWAAAAKEAAAKQAALEEAAAKQPALKEPAAAAAAMVRQHARAPGKTAAELLAPIKDNLERSLQDMRDMATALGRAGDTNLFYPGYLDLWQETLSICEELEEETHRISGDRISQRRPRKYYPE